MKTNYFRLTKTFIVLTLFATILSCNQAEDTKELEKKLDQKGISLIQYDDEEMNKAIKDARLTFDDFKEQIENPEDKYFAVKIGILYPGGKEHLWIVDVIKENGKYFGRVDNEPEYTDDVKLNDIIEIPLNLISDWMIIDGDQLIGGGYTLKLIRDRMTPQERIVFDKESNLNFQDSIS
ncbi:DUF2314 domain-containing protein [Faecalibacter macacae]|uniref:DUF2314 domain-containing protein n=1 Tax=Faecalibacter macacae TaxID=1859289 RepID=A0A3L9M4V5_9FLAO|nr:DUF2314 domain-containing protein [Faecalibacter macacae]RLZ07801.1 DUF2314 domain-containing protein [Faecalibacter macacae]